MQIRAVPDLFRPGKICIPQFGTDLFKSDVIVPELFQQLDRTLRFFFFDQLSRASDRSTRQILRKSFLITGHIDRAF